MIRMGVRIQDGIDLWDRTRQELCSEVRARIDKQTVPAFRLDDDRRAAPSVPWLGWITLPPISTAVAPANHRHARRSAASKHDDAHHAALEKSRLKFLEVTSPMCDASVCVSLARTSTTWTT